MSDTPKPAAASAVEMTEIVLPSHANALGTVFGGQVAAWIDIAAGAAAMRHARNIAVTASPSTHRWKSACGSRLRIR